MRQVGTGAVQWVCPAPYGLAVLCWDALFAHLCCTHGRELSKTLLLRTPMENFSLLLFLN